MQLLDLVFTIENATDAELVEWVRQMRHNREEVRPAFKNIVQRAVTKTKRKNIKELTELLASLSPEEQKTLLEQFGE
jgi:hypothetical protein